MYFSIKAFASLVSLGVVIMIVLKWLTTSSLDPIHIFKWFLKVA